MKIALRLWLVLGLTFSSLSISGEIVEVGGGSYFGRFLSGGGD